MQEVADLLSSLGMSEYAASVLLKTALISRSFPT
jgi:hypothetical protein